jgi:sterol desaturase/sphingolipid hydroxylase (fatty acid hydroxylase superfamily)
MERTAAAIGQVLTAWRDTLGTTFFAPGSSLSLGALACTFAVLVALGIPARRGRRLPLRVLRRALLPDRLWRSASGQTDIGYFLFGLLVFGLAFGWALVSADQVRALINARIDAPGPQPLPYWASATLATVAFFIAYEAAYWTDHWLMHRVPFLWRFHKIHHQAESLSLLTNYRVHPFEAVLFINIQALFFGITGASLERALGGGASPWTLGGSNVLAMLFAVGLNHLQHSHLWITFGPRWGKVLLGPAHHQIHHSADPDHFGRNLGSSFALFDRLFGTFHMPAPRRERLRFGVDDGETAPHGLRAALVGPFLPAARVPDQGPPLTEPGAMPMPYIPGR